MDVLNQFLSRIVVQIINPIILLLAAAAFVVFIWGVFNFIAHAGEATKRDEGKKAIFWGLIGLVIIFGVYGILNVVLGTFSIPIPDAYR
jgi:hypothetical protein